MPKRDPLVTVTLPASKFIEVDENHGGYLGGHCIACGASGWLPLNNRKRDCPVRIALANGVPVACGGDAGWCMKPECRKCHPKASPVGVLPSGEVKHGD